MSEVETLDTEGEQPSTSTSVDALRPDTEGHNLTVKVEISCSKYSSARQAMPRYTRLCHQLPHCRFCQAILLNNDKAEIRLQSRPHLQNALWAMRQVLSSSLRAMIKVWRCAIVSSACLFGFDIDLSLSCHMGSSLRTAICVWINDIPTKQLPRWQLQICMSP